MTDIISQYYQSIVQQLRSEVDTINSLFHHQGVKGEGNEAALRELLTKFIPKRYSVGTGVVIDRNGTQSRQCDIVIYDTLLYPSLLTLTNIHFFPVDIVYATIEVKTTLTSGSVKEALENIASVKKLDLVPDNFAGSYSRGGEFQMAIYTPTTPLGFIFGYNSDAQQFETFRKWLTPTNASEILSLPSMTGCLDQGLILLTKDKKLLTHPQAGMQIEGRSLPLTNSQNKAFEFPDARESYTHNNHIYPVKKFADRYFVIDQSRVLLFFLLALEELLAAKTMNPGFSFLQTYFRDQPIIIW